MPRDSALLGFLKVFVSDVCHFYTILAEKIFRGNVCGRKTDNSSYVFLFFERSLRSDFPSAAFHFFRRLGILGGFFFGAPKRMYSCQPVPF